MLLAQENLHQQQLSVVLAPMGLHVGVSSQTLVATQKKNTGAIYSLLVAKIVVVLRFTNKRIEQNCTIDTKAEQNKC